MRNTWAVCGVALLATSCGARGLFSKNCVAVTRTVLDASQPVGARTYTLGSVSFAACPPSTASYACQMGTFSANGSVSFVQTVDMRSPSFPVNTATQWFEANGEFAYACVEVSPEEKQAVDVCEGALAGCGQKESALRDTVKQALAKCIADASCRHAVAFN